MLDQSIEYELNHDDTILIMHIFCNENMNGFEKNKII